MKRRLWLAILCLFVVLFCCGCGAEPEAVPAEATPEPSPEPVYEYEAVYLRLMEPCGTGFVLQESVCQTVVGARTYQFVSSISEADRAAFIRGQEALCALMEAQGISTEGKRFVVLPAYTNWTDSDGGAAYYGLDCMNGWRQALTTLQLALGDYTNYGYLYALADDLAAELGWRRDEAAEAGALRDPVLLNLVYPCFDAFYTPAEEIAACKALSKELLAGLDGIRSEEAFLLARETWAAAQGLDFQPTALRFAYAGESCPLKLRTSWLEIFRTPAFTQDAYAASGLFEEDFLSSLDGMIRGLDWLDRYLTTLRETFGADDPALVPVVLQDEVGKYAEMTYSGYFHAAADGGHITSNSLHTLVHEYVHYLYWLRGGPSDPAYESWINEVAACTFALPVEYEAFYRSYLLAEPEIRAKRTEKLGKDFEGPEDYIRYLRIVCRTEELPHPYKYYLISEYALRPVFGAYFIRTYGEDVFLAWVLAPSRSVELTGRSVDEIVDDWCADMDMPEND